MIHLVANPRHLISLIILVVLTGCAAHSGKQTVTSNATQTPLTSTPVAAEMAPDSEASIAQTTSLENALEPGRHCFATETETLSAAVRLTVDEDTQVTGDSQATIQNEEAGYYSSYAQRLSGILMGGQLDLDITTWIEYDVQDTREIWIVTPDLLDTGREVFEAVDCEAVRDRFTTEGLEAEDLLADAVVHTQRVEFAPGRDSAVLENSVIRGERDVYLLGAEGGQTMILSINSLEDNAVFDVVSPSGQILIRESTEADLLLPHTGDYQVIVGGTRGNATYSLNIAIN